MRRGTSGLNLLLGVSKPCGMSSHDVVNAVRRSLGERRVGHAGTLDPAADGVLVVGVGQGTRLMGLLTADSKSYLATIRFGFETATDDAEGELVREAALPPELRDAAWAQRLLDSFLGEQQQVPPAYSAISVDGRRAYARARAGEQVELAARTVRIDVAQLLSIEQGRTGEPAAQAARQEVDACAQMDVASHEYVDWQCAFSVSKGTYVRSIARDLGRRTGSAAHLARLCRTASGTVTLGQCVSLERLDELGAQGVTDVALDPVAALALPARELSERERKDASFGRPLEAQGLERGSRVALVHDGLLWGVWESDGVRLKAQTNFPQGIAGVRHAGATS